MLIAISARRFQRERKDFTLSVKFSDSLFTDWLSFYYGIMLEKTAARLHRQTAIKRNALTRIRYTLWISSKEFL